MNGRVWQDNRNFCMATLRSLGFGKSTVESKLLDEFSKLAEEIDKAEGKALYLGLHFVECAANQLASFFIPRIQSDSRVRGQLTAILKRIFVMFQGIEIYQFWPRLWQTFFQFIPFTSNWKVKAVLKDLENFVIKEMASHVEASGERNFIKAYTEKIHESTGKQNSSYQHRYLVGNIKEFLMGGIDGPSNSMQLHMVMFAARQNDIQRRVQREIDAVIGHGRLPTWEDRKQMPFTLACVWELERWKRTEPFGLPRGRRDLVDHEITSVGEMQDRLLWAVREVERHLEDTELTRSPVKSGMLLHRPREKGPRPPGVVDARRLGIDVKTSDGTRIPTVPKIRVLGLWPAESAPSASWMRDCVRKWPPPRTFLVRRDFYNSARNLTDEKHPIVLPQDHLYCELLVVQKHRQLAYYEYCAYYECDDEGNYLRASCVQLDIFSAENKYRRKYRS
ncbi:hypothetical protein MTO96_008119 [Rhipicephalus appendiculatus]